MSMPREVAEQLVQGWHKDWWTVKTLKIGFLASGEIVTTLEGIGEALGIFIKGFTCRAFLAHHYPTVSNRLWDGIDDVRAVDLLTKTKPRAGMKSNLPSRRPSKETNRMFINFRERDKRRDWRTVK